MLYRYVSASFSHNYRNTFYRQKFKAQFELSKIQRLPQFIEIYPQQKRKMISSLRLI